MTEPKTNPKVDAFIGRTEEWREEYEALRGIVLGCGLTEELKWGQPCYANEGRNVVLIHAFKDYCALLFMKGALMKDPAGILVQQTDTVQSARQIRFTSADQIAGMATMLKAYMHEAIEIGKSGAKVDFKKAEDFAIPEEFKAKLAEVPDLKTAFDALTPGRRKGYLLHFAGAKQAKTREARIEKYVPKILQGKGLDD